METTQPTRIGDRMAGTVLIIAAAIMFTGAAIGFLAPSLSEAPPFVTEDMKRVAAAIAGNPTAPRRGFLLRNGWRFEFDDGSTDTLRSGGQLCC